MFAVSSSFGQDVVKTGSLVTKGRVGETVDAMSDQDREKYLLEWTTARCGEDGAAFTFDEGWDMITRFGLNILSDMLKRFLLNEDGSERKERKPLGMRGWAALYTTSYQMVNLSITSGEIFYQKICEFMHAYVTTPSLQDTIAGASLIEFIAVWQAYKIMTKWIWHLFMHLETSVIKLNDLFTLTAVALTKFREKIYDPHHENLTMLALSTIEREREGEIVDHTLLQETLQIFLTMGLAAKIDANFASEKRDSLKNIDSALKLQGYRELYFKHFEEAFLEDSQRFYARKSAEWVAAMDVPSYTARVDAVLQQEDQRCTAYLCPVTRAKLHRVLLKECIVVHRDAIFDAAKEIFYATYDNSQHQAEGCCALPKEKAQVVERLYRYCNQCQALEPSLPAYALGTRLCTAFQGYVVEMGLKIVEDRRAEVAKVAEESKAPSKPAPGGGGQAAASAATADAALGESRTIDAILRLIQNVPQMVQSLMDDDRAYKQACKDAFTTVVNADLGKCGVMHMLATYCDNLLKGNLKVTDAEVDRMLRSCMTVFSHLLDKDMFADLHRTYLAKRLLAKRSISDDAEKLLVGLMKMQCGAQFTSKLEGMLYDHHLATTSQTEYETTLRQWQDRQPREVRQIAFTNTLLTSTYWPTQRPRAYTLPPEMRALQQHYSDWHKTKFSVRTLQWVATLGDVSVAMAVPGRDFELTVTLLQAVVLRCFHQHRGEALSFEQVQAQSGIDDEEVLKRVLHSLACQKFKILVKSSEGKGLAQDSYRANAAFTNKLRKFRVPMAAIDDTEQGGVSRGMQEDRGNAVDASIVRVMKARKVLAHADLQYEVLRQITGFHPDPKFIKQRVESLIERDFLERDENDARVYKYLP